jgi:hypothetical protein
MRLEEHRTQENTMLYDDPEDDLGNDLSPEEQAVTHRVPFNYSDDEHDMDLADCEWMAELGEIHNETKKHKEEVRHTRSEAAKRAWERRKANKRKKKPEVRSIDSPWSS